ncbi:MAG: YajQ family cyclic di-GMP-binding protein [Acidiferrobacterales bacterium]
MPSFDVVSKIEMQEVRNAVDQANREIDNRFDLKGTDSRVELAESRLTLFADDEFKIKQIRDILLPKLVKRQVDLECLDEGKIETASGGKARQEIQVREGIDADLARKIVKLIKDSRLKSQAAIQGDQVRVTGKKRDDLQAVISLLRAQKLGLPLQYVNFRD